MRIAQTRISHPKHFAVYMLVLWAAITTFGIPPRQNTISMTEASPIGIPLGSRETHVIIQPVDRDQAGGTVAEGMSGPWLGIGSVEASEALDAQLGLRRGEGLVVIVIVTNSPAAKAGLQKNDVLVELEGQRLVHPAQFRKLLQMKKEGEHIELTLFRGGKKQIISATLEKAPAEPVLRGALPEGKKVEMGTRRPAYQDVNEVTSAAVSAKTAMSLRHGIEPAKSAPTTKVGFYMQRQGWKADFRTIVAMAKWLVLPESSQKCCPAPTEPISTSITEVVHGRNLGNI